MSWKSKCFGAFLCLYWGDESREITGTECRERRGMIYNKRRTARNRTKLFISFEFEMHVEFVALFFPQLKPNLCLFLPCTPAVIDPSSAVQTVLRWVRDTLATHLLLCCYGSGLCFLTFPSSLPKWPGGVNLRGKGLTLGTAWVHR